MARGLIFCAALMSSATATSVYANPEAGNCFGYAEVATRSYADPLTLYTLQDEESRQARIVTAAEKIGARFSDDEIRMITDKVFNSEHANATELGQAVAASCLKQNGFNVPEKRAETCFTVARYTREFALDRKFMPLDLKLEQIGKIVGDPLEKDLTVLLAKKVYEQPISIDTAFPAAKAFYMDCVTQN